jgi:DNA-binding beta-propeller fold protein YncE
MIKIITTGLIASLLSASVMSADITTNSTTKNMQPTLIESWRIEKSLLRPESVIYDEDRSVLYVSNINGKPTGKDGNGYISRISTDGEILREKWIVGLDAPKGMAIYGDFLYVSDIDRLVKISLEKAEIVNAYSAPEALFLNDVAVDGNGVVYVSDSKRQTIYQLSEEQLTVWVSDERISRPNGLYAQDDVLLVAAGDASAKKPGRSRYLQTISYQNKSIQALSGTVPIGSVDGIERSKTGEYFLTDFRSGDIFYYTPEKGAVIIQSPEKSTADLDYDAVNNMLYVPILKTGKLIAYKVLWSE